jgi:SOS regulatory protein LexA
MSRPNHDRQHLAKLQDHYARFGVLPSLSGICDVVGFSAKNSAARLAKRLKVAGFLRESPDGRLVPEPQFFSRPLAPTAIRAGPPDLAQAQPIDEITIDTFLIDKPSVTVLVPVKGMSMRNAGIFDRDIVVVERRSDAQDGDFVVALVDGEVTVKELKLDGKRWILQPHNEEFPTIVATRELEILGVVTGVLRRYARKRESKHVRRPGGGV